MVTRTELSASLVVLTAIYISVVFILQAIEENDLCDLEFWKVFGDVSSMIIMDFNKLSFLLTLSNICMLLRTDNFIQQKSSHSQIWEQDQNLIGSQQSYWRDTLW